MYPRGRQIEGPARTAPCVPGREAEQVSRLRYLAAVSKLDPDFAEEFLTFVVREVIRRHESVRRNHLTCISG
jgi:chorismate mutase